MKSTLLVLGLAFLVACGGKDPDPLKIVVATFAVDAPAPERFVAVHVLPDGTETTYALIPADGEPGTHVVSGGPEGAYRVDGPEGWWMLHLGTTLPEVLAGRAAPRIQMGRAYTLYLGPSSSAVRPGPRWGAERVSADGQREVLPVEVLPEPDGYTVAVRFRPEDWSGTIEVVGELTGAPTRGGGVSGTGPLSDKVVFEARPEGRLRVARVQEAARSPFDVILVPASPDDVVDGREVRATVVGLPVDMSWSAECAEGRARFPVLPAMQRDLAIQVGADGAALRLDPEARRRHATLRLLVARPDATRRVVITVPEGVEVDGAQARPATAVAFGRVAFEQVGSEVTLELPSGKVAVLLAAETRWAALDVEGEGAQERSAPPFEEAVVVEGRVEASVPGTIVRLFRVLGDEAVLGDAFEVRVTPSGTFQARIPAGTWLVEVAAPRTLDWRRPAPLVLDAPGARIHLPLRPR